MFASKGAIINIGTSEKIIAVNVIRFGATVYTWLINKTAYGWEECNKPIPKRLHRII